LFAAAAFTSTAVYAQDTDLELIVVADDGGQARVAGSAHVVGEEELERFEYDDIHRVLSGIPGVQTRGEDAFGLRPNIGIRGANSDRSAKITLMEDGVLLAPAPYAAPAAYYFPMTTRMVGVEVFKGPAATQHGPHTIGGAINLVTRPIPADGPAMAFDQAIGSFRSAKLHAWGGTGNTRTGVLFEGVHLSSGGFKELDTGGPTGFNRSELMFKARVGTDRTLARYGSAELKLGYARERSFETYLGLAAPDLEGTPNRRYAASELGLMGWHRTQVELAFPLQFGDDLALRTVLYHHYMTRQWTKFNRFGGAVDTHALLMLPGEPAGQSAVYLAILRGEEDTDTDDQALFIGTNDRRFHALGAQSRLRWDTELGPLGSRLEAGLRVHADIVDRLHTEGPHDMTGGRLFRAGSDQTTLDADDRATAVAAHLHEELSHGALRVLPGLRLETVRTRHEEPNLRTDPVSRTMLLPGLAMLLEPARWLDLFAGAHLGFSPVAPGSSDEVKPERAWNYEAGGRLGHDGPHLELVGFLSDYANLTGDCTLSGGCDDSRIGAQFNGGEVRVYGLEAVAGTEVLLPKQLTLPLRASYGLTESAFQTGFHSEFPQFGDVEAGDRLPYVAVHGAALHAGIQHPRAGLSSSLTHRSGLLDAAAQPDQVPEVPALTTLDLAVDGALVDGVHLYGTLTNVTGVQQVVSWRPLGARPNAPRQLMVGLKGSLPP
jgi:Fe(3+) dicitrate transport protein